MEKSKINLLIFGPPGSGKGTQARLLAKHLDGLLEVISIGDLLRNEIASGTDIGEEVRDVMKKGALVCDALVSEMLFRQLRRVKCGFLLDGFPRNLRQAKFLSAALMLLDCDIDVVIKLEVSDEIVESRLKGRLVCEKCGKVSNVLFNENKCTECGSYSYARRDDDVLATIRQRIEKYNSMVGELESYYKDKVVKIDGNGSIQQIFADIKDRIY